MVTCWVFSSKNRENIRRASERLVWGFWDKDLMKSKKSEFAKKLAKNWRYFLRAYNRIVAGDIVFFQIAGAGEIHAIGVVKDKYYDDQTSIWDVELEKRTVVFPWRVSFYIVIYSEEPFTRIFTELKNYVDGYGIGGISPHEARAILSEIEKKTHININIHI